MKISDQDDLKNELWENVSKGDASEKEKAHELWLSKFPPQYCVFHKEEQLILKAEESLNRIKSDNGYYIRSRYDLTPELASNNWRFYFIGECKECKWLAKATEIPMLAHDFSFDNFECDQENLKNIVDRAKSFANNLMDFCLCKEVVGLGKLIWRYQF